jgi:nucleotide-binding universal stress UspA family protein
MTKARTRCVVVGYDGTAPSERALSWALQRAGRGGRVVLVHAARHQPDRLRIVPEATGPGRLAHARAVAELPFLERRDVYDVQCDSEVRDASPADALMSVAAGVEADEIVIGTRRRDRLRSAAGSVCSDLLQRSPCPVVVIP